jgi:AcrR family transcriptional regulator
MIAYYFGSRRGLYEAMFERAIDRLGSKLATQLETLPPGADPIETLIRTHTTAIAAEPWIPQLIAREVLAREGSLREHFKQHVGAEPLGLVRGAINDAIERGVLRSELDPTLTLFTLLSLSAFPYLIGPVLGDQLGIELDEAFRERLIDHNLALVARGLRAREEDRR